MKVNGIHILIMKDRMTLQITDKKFKKKKVYITRQFIVRATGKKKINNSIKIALASDGTCICSSGF